jgi:catechol 2,3-dioxygenase-like lactoylglutathione lyase family enzyme
MDQFIGRMLSEFEAGKMSRRQLIQTLAVATIAFGAGETAFAADPATLGFSTICVNHISYQCSGTDYGKARDFYVKLLGMDYPPNMDTGGQAYLPFGPKEAGTFMLPRGGRDPNAGPAPERGGGGRGAAGRGGRGAAGRGGAAGAENAEGGGRGPQEKIPLTVVVDQVGYTVANFNVKKAGEALKKFGLDAKQDGDAFTFVDPFGMEIQISGDKLNAY